MYLVQHDDKLYGLQCSTGSPVLALPILQSKHTFTVKTFAQAKDRHRQHIELGNFTGQLDRNGIVEVGVLHCSYSNIHRT